MHTVFALSDFIPWFKAFEIVHQIESSMAMKILSNLLAPPSTEVEAYFSTDILASKKHLHYFLLARKCFEGQEEQMVTLTIIMMPYLKTSHASQII